MKKVPGSEFRVQGSEIPFSRRKNSQKQYPIPELKEFSKNVIMSPGIGS
jgi:hypothetical protein